MRVLIIDDSRANRMVLQKFMKEFGFESVEAESGLDAIWALKRNADIDLITVDYNMPRMNGVQFARLVREKPELSHIPILMITSENTAERQEEAFEAGVNEFLMKPFNKEMIEAKLDALGLNKKGPETKESGDPSQSEDDW